MIRALFSLIHSIVKPVPALFVTQLITRFSRGGSISRGKYSKLGGKKGENSDLTQKYREMYDNADSLEGTKTRIIIPREQYSVHGHSVERGNDAKMSDKSNI